MPVNTAALKTFAPAMRRQLLEAVGRKLDLLLNSQTPDTLSTYAKQIAELREQEAENREQLLERVAYTWFNRLCALRYLDAKGWHPFGCMVLMPAGEDETQPELLKLMRAGSLPGELKPHTNEARLHGLLDGQIPPAMAGSDPQGEVYRELVLASCRSYHQLLPELFEGLDDASELLLPDYLLSEGSIAGGFRIAISDEDCEDVEIIGWLYQFYISEKKDQVIGKVVKSEDIPAATQLFTPNWIVKYMVQNTIGAQWLATYPDSPLREQMEFYIEPAEQTLEIQSQLEVITPETLDPEAITLLDPACGSGHILVEAYDLLKAIYLERGYRQRDIPELILAKNLFGLDICPRAAQLSAFSLLMKGREDNRRLLEQGIQLNVTALQDSIGLNVESLAATVDLAAAGVSRADVRMLCELFTHATTLGSLIQVPALLAEKLPPLMRLAEQINQDLLASKGIHQLVVLARQASMLDRRYDAVVANPPYMDGKYHSPTVKGFLTDNYSDYRKNLFSAFLVRALSLTKTGSYSATVTPFTWMYIASFEKLRADILSSYTITSLVKPSYTSFFESAIVSLVTLVIRKNKCNYRGTYYDLGYLGSAESQPIKLRQALEATECDFRYFCRSEDFEIIPGFPFAYWVSEPVLRTFDLPRLGDLIRTEGQNKTADNDRFLRLFWEVGQSSMGRGKRWIPYAKGGPYRKWFGNGVYLVDWSESAINHYRSSSSCRIVRERFWYSEGVTWTDVTSGMPSFRFLPGIGTFDMAGPTAFFDCGEDLRLALALLNSTYSAKLLPVLNPTCHIQLRDVAAIPLATIDSKLEYIDTLIEMSRTDWNHYESSWDFQSHPLHAPTKEPATTLQVRYLSWTEENRRLISEMREIEEKNNRLLIDAYGLRGELSPDVPTEQITLTVNPSYRYGGDISEKEKWTRFQRDSLAEFCSYLTGCLMGRYSIDKSGLILADSLDSQADHLNIYEEKVGKPLSEVQFKPDPDGIVPVLDGEWFEDDIVARTREFLAVTFPESSVAENLRFIEESLDKDIRKYFCSEFYKDHLQTYKKRPIYWMVQSPKKGFACLFYLHRYTKDTLNQVLNNYFRPYLQKLEARLAQLEQDQINDDLKPRERTAARKEAEKITKVLKECQAWEQDALLPLAQQRIELDLDDGVKVNYLKLQDVLATIPGLAAKEE